MNVVHIRASLTRRVWMASMATNACVAHGGLAKPAQFFWVHYVRVSHVETVGFALKPWTETITHASVLKDSLVDIVKIYSFHAVHSHARMTAYASTGLHQIQFMITIVHAMKVSRVLRSLDKQQNLEKSGNSI